MFVVYVKLYNINPEEIRCKVIGVEMKGVNRVMKMVALCANVRQIWKKGGNMVI